MADGDPDGPVGFLRRDGTPGTVRAHRLTGGVLLETDPPPLRVPLVVQVEKHELEVRQVGPNRSHLAFVGLGIGDQHPDRSEGESLLHRAGSERRGKRGQ